MVKSNEKIKHCSSVIDIVQADYFDSVQFIYLATLATHFHQALSGDHSAFWSARKFVNPITHGVWANVDTWGYNTDMEIVVYPGILVPRKYFSWQKIFFKMLKLNYKIDYNVRKHESIKYFL